MRKLLLGTALLALGYAPAFAENAALIQHGKAVWTEGIVESVGVNVHLHYDKTAYVKQWSRLRDLMLQSGIRHVRDGLIDTTWQPYYDHLNELGRAGVGVTLVANAKQSPELLSSYPSRVRRIDAYEAPNEADRLGVPALRAFQQTLWRAAKTLPKPLPVIGPSLTSAQAYASLGDLSDLEDYGNMHDYFGGNNPETPGWGDAGFGSRYGSIAYNLAVAEQASNRRPIVATENGYITELGDSQGIPENIVGRYVPRMILAQAAAGIPRTFIYELVDEENQPLREAHFGLLTQDLHEKPGFVALREFLAAMRDPGPAFTPDDVDLDVQSDANDVRTYVLEKRAHTVILALWRGVPSYNVRDHRNVAVSKTDVRIRFHGPAPRAVARTFDEKGFLVSEAITRSKDAVSVLVDDHVTLLSFPLSSSSRRTL